jgi:hypothetical protein
MLKASRLGSLCFIVFVAALLNGCSDDETTQPVPKGSLELVVTYTGSLDTVSAAQPVVVRLFHGSNAYATGTPAATAAATASPDTLLIDELTTGEYTLVACFDRDVSSEQIAGPYELYLDKPLGQTPNLITITEGAVTPIEVAFDDTYVLEPWEPLPAFALPDSNAQSPTYGTTLTNATFAGGRALIYFAGPATAPAPEFALDDVNPTSPTLGVRVALSSLRGKRVLIYFGWANCPLCVEEFAGVKQIIEDLHAEGLANAAGMMINDATAAYDADELEEVGALLPALQDTFALIGGSYKKAIRYLYDCQNVDPVIVLDEDGYIHHRAVVGGAIDLRQQDTQDLMKDWMREASSGTRCGGCGDQCGQLTTLRAEAVAAGVQPLSTLMVTRRHDGCLLRSLLVVGGELPILEDAVAGLAAATGAQSGELLLIDTAGRTHWRLLTGAGDDQEVDLTLAADRQQVIGYLQALE